MKSYTITIDENVPLADKKPGAQSKYCHPLGFLLPKLKPGHSILYPPVSVDQFNGLRSYAYYIGKRLGRRFATRVKDNRLRIWRTE